MEALLSLAFDNIASKDTQKIRKGLRQIEGMLAQICLSSGKAKPSTPGHRRNASSISMGEPQEATPKKLGQLSEDPAFREFFRLQEGFEWNGETRAVVPSFMTDPECSCDTSSRLSRAVTGHG
jgi:hypothetical protein